MVVEAVIPALRRLKQDNGEFKANLGYIAKSFFKNKTSLPLKKTLQDQTTITTTIKHS
jgi:hypothetical protein